MGRRLTLLLVIMALVLAAASAWHLIGAGTAWVTPFVAVISALLVLAVLATLPAVLANVTWLRLALPVVLLGANAGFIVAHELGVRLVSFTPYSSTRFALTLMAALVLGAIGLLRRRMWARWLYLALGAAAIGSGGLNAINYWPVSGRVDPLHVAWSHQTIESCWGFLVSAIAGLVIVANLAGAGAAFSAGPSHTAWTSDHRLVRVLRLLVVTALVAVPMLLVYAWMQPIVPATVVPAQLVAAVLTLGVAAAARGWVLGALLLVVGGAGLLVVTAATYFGAEAGTTRVASYYVVFWLPAALTSLACAGLLAGPVLRLLRR